MRIRKLSLFEFDEYAKSHPLRSYHQSSNYAIFMAESGFDYDFIGYVDENDGIHAASLILHKKIDMFNKYGYAPKGFLMDYYDEAFVKEFTTALKKYYYKRNFAFIKINPEIAIGEINIDTKVTTYNNNLQLVDMLERNNFKKLKNNTLFEAILPRFNAILILKQAAFSKLSKPARNKIRKGLRKGLYLEKGSRDDISILYKFIKNKKKRSENFYKNYYNVFSKSDDIDVFLVKIDFEECLINARENYEIELEKNKRLVAEVMKNNNEANLKRKMASDLVLQNYKNDIVEATQGLSQSRYKYIAGCIAIKYENRVSIVISGFNNYFKRYNPNYFLHYKLIEHYKRDYDFMDLNGITGEFNEANPYNGLNDFKFAFKPKAFEYIGEFDFIINEGIYKGLVSSGLLAQEFTKKQKLVKK